MSDSDVDTAQLRSQLIEEFHLLPPLEEKIIQLFSASKKMLTQRLREMENDGLVKRQVISTKQEGCNLRDY